jgi:dynein heavy chain, axonemal
VINCGRFAEWYKTLWARIDVDFLSEETKKLQKDIKSLNKAVRNYEVYRLMEEKLKAMSTSLPLVGDLAHPAMRDRHWEQLMRATGKTFVKDDKFSLGDLLNLGLHNYVDDCSEIVDRAQKVSTPTSFPSHLMSPTSCNAMPNWGGLLGIMLDVCITVENNMR